MPRLQTGDALPGKVSQAADLLRRGVQPLGKRRLGRDGLARDGSVGLPEKPGVSEDAPADHTEVRAGILQDVGRVLPGEDIAVCGDGDLHRLLHFPDDVPVGPAGVHLHPGAAVDADGVRPGAFQSAGKVHGVDAAPVPALAEFHRHGHGNSFLHRLHDPSRQGRVLHEGGAVPGLHDLAHGTAHVDIQNVRAGELQCQLCPLGHDLRLVAEDLHGPGAFLRQAVEQGFGLLVPVHQGLGGDHLRGAQRRPFPAAEGAEGKVRHPRHGGQHRPSLQFDVSDFRHRSVLKKVLS